MLIRAFQTILALFLSVVLVSCSTPTPPTELAPEGEIVKQAIMLQLNQTQQRLSQQLKASLPELEISQIKVNLLEPVVVENLPTYHLQGTYNLKLILPRQVVTQRKNEFEVYLQRQVEGKTWRLLRQEILPNQNTPQWRSYLIS